MRSPEVIHPCPTKDAAEALPSTARDQNLQVVIERAQDQLLQLSRQRQEIAQRMSIIKRTIHGLALLYSAEFQPSPDKVATGERRRGITNACRAVLNRADTPLTAREVHCILQSEFPDLFRQPGDYYASLVTILNRLAKYGEAETFLRNGNRFWQRNQSADPRPTVPSGD